MPLPVDLKALTDEQLSILRSSALERIRETTSRIHYAEGRRGTFSALAVGLIAAGVALLAALLTNSADVTFRPGLWTMFTAGIGAVATGLVTLWLYAEQTNFDYPFKTSAPTWKWFYRDAVPEAGSVDTPWHTRLRHPQRTAAEAAFTSAWENFARRELTLLDARVSFEQDINQLFVLYANEFYKNRFLTQVRRVFQVGILATAAAAIIVLAITWACEG